MGIRREVNGDQVNRLAGLSLKAKPSVDLAATAALREKRDATYIRGMSWRTALKYEVRTRDGQKLRALADVRAYVLELPEGRSERQYWQHMAALLLEACETGKTEEATRQLMLALLHDGALDLSTETV